MREDLGNGHIVAICQSIDCRSNHEQCEVGVFKIFEGIHGTFLGCHDYSRTKCKGKKSVK